MTDQLSTQNLMIFLAHKQTFVAMPMFNRLEARPRTHNFDRALRAEVRDALWMLTKQWQMGEFMGDDAGSPVSAKVRMEKTMLTKYRPAQYETEGFDDTLPLEAKVEKRPIPFSADELEIALDLRLLMGRQWLKLLEKHSLATAYRDAYRQNFPVYQPHPFSRADAGYCASHQSWRKHSAVAGRQIDGKKLYDNIATDPAHHVSLVGAVDPDHILKLTQLGERFVRWFDQLYYQPTGDEQKDAWLPSSLEYQFSCSAPKNGREKVYKAEEYYHGHLDWYNFSLDPQTAPLGEVEEEVHLPEGFDTPVNRSLIPTPVQFDGMPNNRWWTFEESRTNFGGIQPDTTDINKLLLIQFGLIYANDWYIVPFTLPSGTIANIRGMSVRNVFGENYWIASTGRGLDDDPERWTMYSLDIAGKERQPPDLCLMVVPSVPKIQEGKAIEEVQLVRDEVANMVWGIEKIVPLPSGDSLPGREAALDTLRFIKRLISELPPEEAEVEDQPVNPRYKIMSSVPENWIPFISTHEEDSNRETRLQRGSMPRIIEGDPQETIEKIKPRTNLLREGLNQNPKRSYYINEEEVPRAGILVTQSFQRTRWYNGQVITWLGVRKRTGRGEASSQLKFDYLLPPKKPEG